MYLGSVNSCVDLRKKKNKREKVAYIKIPMI